MTVKLYNLHVTFTNGKTQSLYNITQEELVDFLLFHGAESFPPNGCKAEEVSTGQKLSS